VNFDIRNGGTPGGAPPLAGHDCCGDEFQVFRSEAISVQAAVIRGQCERTSRHHLAMLTAALLGLSLTGCGGPPRAAPVDVTLAESTLLHVLLHWQAGGAIEDLRQQTPEIVAKSN
jgi:hypothetical protein